MKKIFQYIMLAVVTIVMASCTSDIEETTATTGKSNVQLVVGEFPAFGDSQTRTIGTPDEGKTSWAEGDELLLVIDNTSYGKQYATFTYNGSSWELTSGELVYREGDPAYIPHVYYAPNYKWEAGKLVLKEGKVAGTDEYIEGNARITGNGETITVSFAGATRNYSRLRIATMPNKPITVAISKYTPAGSSDMKWDQNYALTSDEKGNAYLYGTFENNSEVTVKYREAALTTYTFSQATESAKSYALDATVVSLADEGITYDQIVEDVKKELDAGKTYINLILAPDVDAETLEAINIGLKDARDGSINLTLIGCKKIPYGVFMHCKMLKSIALPDVTEIEGKAFSGCTRLKKVVLGNLTKVYGNVGKNGIFDGLDTKNIDLVLSKDQKAMNDGEAEGRYCWTADIIKDYDLSDEHVSKKFLGYEFKSITCRYKFE
ncbi:leucine-rich repeat domain-containing protein [Segatella copri]|uniref:Leucine-rich repeat domain-containing protein n=1 Tax=Segatella copri TaxID=165179 RepID=A0AAW5TNM9_9BACT|nr:leucine-rich repeat domain-containing protein [Segatella copri]MCW4075877.1 leucine-rich repeat domain-containing protein [Segatella copri]MCW4092513.1 leucine-rich repeat domain-containing protein [Segatella copri]MCW4107050.1 leucine-rich repeat domain-containing protein [Segatella copri]